MNIGDFSELNEIYNFSTLPNYKNDQIKKKV